MKLISIFLLVILSFSNKKSLTNPAYRIQMNGIFKSDKMDVPDALLSKNIKFSDMKGKKGLKLSKFHKIKLNNVSVNPADQFGLRNLKSIKIYLSTDSKKEIQIASYDVPDNNIANIFMNINYNGYLDDYLNDPSLEYRINYIVRSFFKSEKKYNVESDFTAESLDAEKQ